MISAARIDHWLKRIIFFLFNLLLIVTPFIFTWFNEELFEFSKMLFAYLITILIGGMWLSRMLIRKKLFFKKTILDWPLLAFVVSQSLAALFSLHQRTSIFGYYTRFHGGLLSTLSYAVLYWSLVSNFNFREIKLLLRSALLAAIGVSLYAIPERLGVSPSCILIRGKADVSCWVQDVRSRVFATFGQPNWLAAYLSMLMPLSLGFYLDELSAKKSNANITRASWWLLAGTILWIALLLTDSRSGLLAIGVGLLVFIGLKIGNQIFGSKKPIKTNLVSATKKLALPLVIFAAALLLIGTSFTPTLGSIISKFSSPQHQEEQSVLSPSPSRTTDNKNILITPSEKIRVIVWRGALKIWQRYPIFGSGPATFAYSYYLDRPMMHNLVSEWDFLYNKAHNELLDILAVSGIVGLVSYLWLSGASLFAATKLILTPKFKKHDEVNVLLALLTGLIAFHVSNFVGFSTVMVSILWMVFAAGISLKHKQVKNNGQKKAAADREKNKSRDVFEDKKTPSLIQFLSLFMLGLIQLHLIFGVVRIWQADYLFTKAKAKNAVKEYQEGISKLQSAILLSPNEALFYDELADTYSDIAVEFYQLEEYESAEEFAQLAQEASSTALRLNPYHLNFYKSRSAVFTKLSAIDENYLKEARDALTTAQTLAPTDPKLVYQQGVIELALGNRQTAVNLILKAIEMKPNYHRARYKLGQIYEEQENYSAAIEQYQFILDYLIPEDKNLQEKIKAIQQKIDNQKN